MLPTPDTFEFSYNESDLIYGRGCVHRLGERLGEYGLNRALIVTGTNVGANTDVMESVSAGLGQRLVSVFDETTPEKLGETAFDGIELMEQENPDVLIGVGGGSSLDIARQMSVFDADGRSLSEYREAARQNQLEPPNPDSPVTPVIIIPTTFAGADMSSGGSVEILSPDESPTGHPVRTNGSINPKAIFYDPNLFETTPFGPLSGSSMNGFNKGIETVYARNATPITDATAIRGLKLLRDALPRLPDNSEAMERAIVGMILVQFERRTSIIHAFGHGFARRYDLQQGIAHAVTVPYVLEYLFDHVDARRELLAEGLGMDTKPIREGDIPEAIIEEVVTVRDALGLPSRLRDIDPVEKGDLRDIAKDIFDDAGMDNAPKGLDPTIDELEAVLNGMW